MDKDGAIISKDFLIDYIKFHEKGVILQIQTDTVDEIDIDASRSNNSTLTVYEENTINNQVYPALCSWKPILIFSDISV